MTPPDPKPSSRSREDQDKPSTSTIITDVATGPNVRLKDNLFQGIFTLVSVAIGAGLGASLVGDPISTALPGDGMHPMVGAIIGGIVGLIVGAIVSGGILMVYRLFRH